MTAVAHFSPRFVLINCWLLIGPKCIETYLLQKACFGGKISEKNSEFGFFNPKIYTEIEDLVSLNRYTRKALHGFIPDALFL